MRCITIAGTALAIGLASLALAAPVEVLVGSKGLTQDGLKQALGSAGKVVALENGQFWRVRLAKGFTKAKAEKMLKGKGIAYTLPASAQFVDPNSLKSVRDHIDFMKASTSLSGKMRSGGFFRALEYYLESRVGPDGEIDQAAVLESVRHRDQMPEAYIPQLPKGGNAPTGSATFSYVGPKNLDIPYQRYYGTPPLSGRVNGIAYAPSSPSTIWIATAGGGVWKSTDSGASWGYRSSGWTFLHTTCVAVHPSDPNIVLVGTGDAYGFFGAQTQGIRRSTNGGTTWTTVGAAQFGTNVVSRVLFHPDNPNIVIALTEGATGDIWRSTDGGVTWAATDAPAGTWDDIDYCVPSGGTRALWAVGGNNSTGGRIVRSTNFGANWTAISEPSTSSQGLMDLACSRAVAGKVWIYHSGNNTIYRTTNSGGAWTNLNLSTSATFPRTLFSNTAYNFSQDTYDTHVTSALYSGTEYLYCGLITLAVSSNDGNTWSDLGDSYQSNSLLHNDQHCMAIHPTNGSVSMVGGDGGVFTLNYIPGIITLFTPRNAALQTTQFYHMSLHPTSYSTYMTGGTQDNASPSSEGDLNNWDNKQGGDGAWSGYDTSNPNIHYSQSQGGAIFRYTTLTDTTGDIISPVDANGNVTWSAKFIAPLLVGGGATNVVTGADNRIKRWTGVAGSWTQSASTGSPIRTLARGISNASRVYAGCDNGSVWRSDDGGTTITQIDTAGLPNTAVGGIACRPTDSTQVIVGMQGGGVYRCVNTTAASPVWTNQSGSGGTGLPNTPVNDVVWDPYNGITYYAATDIGLFMTTDAGTTWRNMNVLGLANVHCNSLKVSPDGAYLYVATFGRGIWRIPLANITFTNFTVPSAFIYGDQSMNATMTLSHGAPPGTTAYITESSAYVNTLTSAIFSQNATTRTFTIYTSQVFGAAVNATVYANVMGTVRSVTFQIRPYPTLTSLVLSKTAQYGGPSLTATANLSAPAPLAGTVTFTDNSASVTSPGAASISAGATSRAVTITTAKVASTTVATLTATYKGWARTATLTLYPFPTISSFVINPNPVYGGFGATGTVTLSNACPVATQIGVSETSAFVTTTTPYNMSIGQTVLNFPIGTSPVTSITNVPISTRVVGDTVAATTTTLQLKPFRLTSITLNPSTVTGGNPSTFTVFANDVAPSRGVSVAMSSDKPEATVPTSVSMAGGASSVSGTVTTSRPNVTTMAVISASCNGSIVRATLTINP